MGNVKTTLCIENLPYSDDLKSQLKSNFEAPSIILRSVFQKKNSSFYLHCRNEPEEQVTAYMTYNSEVDASKHLQKNEFAGK